MPVTALTVLSFWCLTVWRDAKGWRSWAWAIGFGVSYGLALMTKQSALLFLAVPPNLGHLIDLMAPSLDASFAVAGGRGLNSSGNGPLVIGQLAVSVQYFGATPTWVQPRQRATLC